MVNHNSFLIVVLSNLNLKTENCYKHDKTLYEGAEIDALTLILVGFLGGSFWGGKTR